MDRYLLDTNVLIFVISEQRDRVSRDVTAILDDPASLLHASAISVLERVQLHRIGKVRFRSYRTVRDLAEAIDRDFDIKILPFGKEHTLALADLEVTPGHKDPFDHAIIAHAMAERMALVSSDRRFARYVPQGLAFVFNER